MGQGTETITAGAPTTENQMCLAVPGSTPALPPHLTAVGEPYRFSPYWWIGCACATPEELRSLQGIVIFNKTECLFLAEDEARKAVSLATLLLTQLGSMHACRKVGDMEERT